jgi:phosphonate transport system permease protein
MRKALSAKPIASTALVAGLAFFAAVSYLYLFGGLDDIRIGNISGLLARMWPPSFEEIELILELAFQTLWMAVLGTALAVAISIPVAVAAASNLSTPWLRSAARGLIAVLRAIPDLVFALILVRSIGLGPLAGILAIGLHSVGMLGRMFADSIEQVDQRTLEALRATGASKTQVFFAAIWPQLTPSLIANSLFRLDINLRSAAVLGLVGAGGLGLLLDRTLGQLDYRGTLGAVVVILLFILAFELLSIGVRRLIISGEDTGWLSRRVASQRFGRPPVTVGALVRSTFWILATSVLVFAALNVGAEVNDLGATMNKFLETMAKLFPPDFISFLPDILRGLLESLSMAVIATLSAALLSIPMGLLASRNLVANRLVTALSRGSSVVIRGIPDLVIAVVLVAAIGLGPAAGIIALAFGTLGFLPKFIADSAEELDSTPREAVLATGASHSQVAFAATIPQLTPALISHILYSLDINLRLSVVVGLVGAGGIGYLLIRSVQSLAFDTTSAIIFGILALVLALEWFSNRLRRLTL